MENHRESGEWGRMLTGGEGLDCNACHYGDPSQLSGTQRQEIEDMVQVHRTTSIIEALRDDLRANHPEFIAEDTADLKAPPAVTQSYFRRWIRRRFNTFSISEIRARIDSGDMPLSKLEPVLASVKSQYDITDAKRESGDHKHCRIRLGR